MGSDSPAYLRASRSDLEGRAEKARQLLTPCRVCPRDCQVHRLAEERGVCKTGSRAMISSFNPHFGEERPLVGRGGSGTIFFSNCNLKCLFCQNYEISHIGEGEEIEPEKLATVMIYLQKLGCENINFVSPTHVAPQILAALPMAAERGLRLPLVYNTGGYDSVETLKLLDGVFDIYMPDMKYASDEISSRLSGVRDYVERNREAVGEMHRQVGDLQIGEDGVAKRGLLVRHLVLPHGLAGTDEVTKFLAEAISRDTYINVMDQYRPCHRAGEIPELARRVAGQEYEEAIRIAKHNGLHRLDSPAGHLLFRL